MSQESASANASRTGPWRTRKGSANDLIERIQKRIDVEHSILDERRNSLDNRASEVPWCQGKQVLRLRKESEKRRRGHQGASNQKQWATSVVMSLPVPGGSRGRTFSGQGKCDTARMSRATEIGSIGHMKSTDLVILETGALAVGLDASRPVPAIVAAAGDKAARRFLEFFAVTIENANTREAYYRACRRFFAWCDARGLRELVDIEAMHVAAYIKSMGGGFEKPSVKQHLAAIRMLFDWLVVGQSSPRIPPIRCAGRSMSSSAARRPS